MNRYAAEDAYMMHEYTYQDREVFMVTNNRIMYLSYNSGTGTHLSLRLLFSFPG